MYDDAKLKLILADPCTSYWLEKSIKELLHRDPVDAVKDAEVLCDLMKDREQQALGIEHAKPWPVIFCEGGLVQDVLLLHPGAKVDYETMEYEVLDYDVLEDQSSEDIIDYWNRRTPELRAYLAQTCPEEYARFQDVIEETKKPTETPAAQLIRVATDTLNRLKEAQETEEGPCSMPWPEVDNLEQAIERYKVEVKK